jgi:hypothetical protein
MNRHRSTAMESRLRFVSQGGEATFDDWVMIAIDLAKDDADIELRARRAEV